MAQGSVAEALTSNLAIETVLRYKRSHILKNICSFQVAAGFFEYV